MSIRRAELDLLHSLAAGSASLLIHASPLSCVTNTSIFPPASPPIPSCPNREIEPGSMSEYATEAGIVVLHGAVRAGLFWTKTWRVYGGGILRTEKRNCKDPETGVYLLCLRISTEASVVETAGLERHLTGPYADFGGVWFWGISGRF